MLPISRSSEQYPLRPGKMNFIGVWTSPNTLELTLTVWPKTSPMVITVSRELVLARLRKIRPNHRLAVLAVVRNEALSLCEWIAHYKAIGVEWFFIYTNNNSDGTDSLLKWFSTWAPITPIFDAAELGVNTQFKAYVGH